MNRIALVVLIATIWSVINSPLNLAMIASLLAIHWTTRLRLHP